MTVASLAMIMVFAAACTRDQGAGTLEAGPGTTVDSAPTSTTSTTPPVATSSSTTTTTSNARAGLGVDRSGPASVLSDRTGSVATADGSWRATGLVRNDATVPVSAVAAEATLLDASGNVLAVVSSDSPVTSVGPGEQVPFVVEAPGVVATQVADVRWRSGGGGSAAGPYGRDLQVTTYWTREAGGSRSLDIYLRREAPGDPRPYALYGSVTAGADAVSDPSVVLAWWDTGGRVIAVSRVPVVDSRGGSVARLAPEMSADFLVILDDPVGAQLGASDPTIWTVGA